MGDLDFAEAVGGRTHPFPSIARPMKLSIKPGARFCVKDSRRRWPCQSAPRLGLNEGLNLRRYNGGLASGWSRHVCRRYCSEAGGAPFGKSAATRHFPPEPQAVCGIRGIPPPCQSPWHRGGVEVGLEVGLLLPGRRGFPEGHLLASELPWDAAGRMQVARPPRLFCVAPAISRLEGTRHLPTGLGRLRHIHEADTPGRFCAGEV